MKINFSEYWKEFIKILKRKEISILPANLAYYFLLSTIPALTLIFFICTIFGLNISTISNFLASIFNENVTNMLISSINISSLNISNIVLFIVVFFLTSNGANSIIVASNVIFDIKDNSIVKRRVKSFILTFILILMITFIMIVPIFGSTIINLLNLETEATKFWAIVFPFVKWPLTIFVLYCFIKLIYTISPDEKIKSSTITRGSIFTTIMWSFVTALFSYYVNNIASYDVIYGTLSNIVILILWYFLLSYIFVVGLALNYKSQEEEIEKTNTIKLKEIQDKVKDKKF